MQLIDALDKRSDGINLVEFSQKVEANYSAGYWQIFVDGAVYKITDEAFDTLLNMLRIPIKYIRRCVEDEGKFLAESSINYWLERYPDISFLVETRDVDNYITQVFPGKRLYIPGLKVNDLIFEYLAGNVRVEEFVSRDDIFNAVYLTDEIHEVAGKEMLFGVRVLYSDCFNITPRFDGVIYDQETGAMYVYPTRGRKFRVAGSTYPQVFEQIEDFLDLSIQGLYEKLVPALDETFRKSNLKNGPKETIPIFIGSLAAKLRLSRKIEKEILGWFGDAYTASLYWINEQIGVHTKSSDLAKRDPEMARDIQIAMSNYLTTGSFK